MAEERESLPHGYRGNGTLHGVPAPVFSTVRSERVLGIADGNEDERIDKAIERTVMFFRQLKLPTSLSDIELGSDVVDAVIANLNKHGRLKMGEHGDIDLEQSQLIHQAAF